MSIALVPYLRNPRGHGVTVGRITLNRSELKGSVGGIFGSSPREYDLAQPMDIALRVLALISRQDSAPEDDEDKVRSFDPRLSATELALTNPPNGVVVLPFTEGDSIGAEVVAALPAGLEKVFGFVLAIQTIASKGIPDKPLNIPPNTLSLRRGEGLVFKPYAAAAAAWIDTGATSVEIPSHLRDWFNDTLTAWQRSDWRMVLILTGVIAEAILADVWQEELNEPTPEKSLGNLCRELTDRVRDLDWREHRDQIYAIGGARNLAVHRFTGGFTKDDAFTSLKASVELLVWYQTSLVPRWQKR